MSNANNRDSGLVAQGAKRGHKVFFSNKKVEFELFHKVVYQAARAYFRIQGKCPTCSKSASYIGNTICPDSPKLMKVLSGNCFK